MDNDELFENFNIPISSTFSDINNKKEENNILLLSKKRTIKHENNDNNNKQNSNSNNNNNKKESSYINEYNTNKLKEKQEDLLLMKEIQTIKESIRTELKDNNIEENTDDINYKINNIPDKEVKIITKKFEGGFHELIYPINIQI